MIIVLRAFGGFEVLECMVHGLRLSAQENKISQLDLFRPTLGPKGWRGVLERRALVTQFKLP